MHRAGCWTLQGGDLLDWTSDKGIQVCMTATRYPVLMLGTALPAWLSSNEGCSEIRAAAFRLMSDLMFRRKTCSSSALMLWRLWDTQCCSPATGDTLSLQASPAHLQRLSSANVCTERNTLHRGYLSPAPCCAGYLSTFTNESIVIGMGVPSLKVGSIN